MRGLKWWSPDCEYLSEEKKFTWKIPNFRRVVAINPQLKDVAYYFESGSSIGLPTTWKLYLIRNPDGTVGLHLLLLQSQEGIWGNFAKFKYETCIVKTDFPTHPGVYYTNEINEYVNGWKNAFFNLATATDAEYDLHLVNGNLEIDISFIIFKEKPEKEQDRYKRAKFMNESTDAVLQDLQKLLDSEDHADVTVETMDGKSLKAHKAILATGSPVFFGMFQHQMTESLSGVVRVEDLTFKVKKAILQFIYTGRLCEGWEKSILEIGYAANKYELMLLFDYCDKNLAATCTPDTAWDLMKFAQLHGMGTAEKEIVEYIRINFDKVIQAEKEDFLAEKS